MCTLTYVPLANGSAIITSNRDESKERARALWPQLTETTQGQKMLMPVDGQAGGSWIIHMGFKTGVVLNGAFERHDSQPPYRVSRGIVLKEAMAFPSLAAFVHQFDLEGIEPFTMVMMGKAVEEVRWDGKDHHLRQYEADKPAIWSAAMLYPKEVRESSEQAFHQFVGREAVSRTAMMAFHQEEYYLSKLGRHGIEPYPTLDTLAVSSIVQTGQQFDFLYRDVWHQLEVHVTS